MISSTTGACPLNLNALNALTAIDGASKVYYYHNDLSGLPQELTDPGGNIVWSATYDAIGRINQILTDEVAQPLRMQGQYVDPQSCTFISQDPLGLAAGENVYAYGPNVWNYIDPL